MSTAASHTPATNTGRREPLTLGAGDQEHDEGHDTEGTLPKQDPVAAAREWRETLRSTPGHEEGYSAGPEEALKTFNVSSAAQLPYILAELNAHGGSIRLDFPVGSPENKDVTREQQAIREFLQKHHNTGLEQLKHELTQFLENSPSYARLAAQPDFTLKFPTARDWVAAHLVQEISNDASLKVADIISAEEISTRPAPDLLVSLEESAKAGRETIITTPPQGEELESIRQKLQSLVSKDKNLLDKPISVWTNVRTTVIRPMPFKVKSIEQLSLAEFLATGPSNKESSESSSKTSSAPENKTETKDSVTGSQTETTPGSAPGHSLILSNQPGAPEREMTTESQQDMTQQKLSPQDQVVAWENTLVEVEKRRDSLRTLLSLAEEVASLERKATWAKGNAASALEKVKVLLAATPDTEVDSTGKKLGEKSDNSERNRARNHNSDEGRAFKKSLYVMQDAEQRLAAARKKLLEASTEAGLDSVRTPKGETAPIITKQTILEALRREGKYAGKLRNKIRRARGTSNSAKKEDTRGETTSDPSHEATHSKRASNHAAHLTKLDRQFANLQRTIQRTSEELKEAHETLGRARDMTGPWLYEANILDTKRLNLQAQEQALARIAALEALQNDPKTRDVRNLSEMQEILQKYKMRTARFFRDSYALNKKAFDEHFDGFIKSNDEKQAYWNQRIIDLEKKLETLRAKLPKPDAAPSDSPTETQVSEQTDSAQDSELTTSDTSAADGTASS